MFRRPPPAMTSRHRGNGYPGDRHRPRRQNESPKVAFAETTARVWIVVVTSARHGRDARRTCAIFQLSPTVLSTFSTGGIERPTATEEATSPKRLAGNIVFKTTDLVSNGTLDLNSITSAVDDRSRRLHARIYRRRSRRSEATVAQPEILAKSPRTEARR